MEERRGLWRLPDSRQGEEAYDDLHDSFPSNYKSRFDPPLAPNISINGVLKMKSFAKQPYCPTSSEILSYVEGSTSLLVRQRVEQHVLLCDFCGAELQLFAKCTPIQEDYTPAPTPAFIKVLGINVHAAAPEVQRARAA